MTTAAKHGYGGWLCPAALALAAFMLFAGLGRLPLMEPDEGRNAQVGHEMMASGAWLVPTLEGIPYLDKPAFFFRAVALSFSAFGETEAAARLPSALFGLALAAATFLFGRRVYGATAGALAAMVLVTMPLFIAYARLVIMDMPLTLFVCVAIFAGYVAEESEGPVRARWHLVGMVSAALATLVKGPVGFILPSMVLGIYFALERKRGWARRSLAPLNLVVFFVIVLSWFIALVRQQPEFLRYGLVEESFHRFTTTSFHRTAPFYYYVPLLAGSCIAYSLLFPEALAAAWKARGRWSSADRLLVIWCVAMVAFFSLSQSKRPGYVLPVVVALALLTSRIFAAALAAPGRARRMVLRGCLVLTIVLGAAVAVLAAAKMMPELQANFLHGKESPSLAILSTSITPILAAALVLLPLAAIACWRASVPLAIAVFVLWMPILGAASFGALAQYAESRSCKDLADKLVARLPPDGEVACLVNLPNSLPFYVKRTVTVIAPDAMMLGSNYIPYLLERTKTWPDALVPFDRLHRWAASRKHPTFLLSGKHYYHELQSVAADSGATIEEIVPGTWGLRLGPPG